MVVLPFGGVVRFVVQNPSMRSVEYKRIVKVNGFAVGTQMIIFAQAIIVKFVVFRFVVPIAEMNTVQEPEALQLKN
jgi:hypothetical protein|tara:strand:- start:1166 stop:1393 length:228 start_codon:yes stop_codon:yes gene_type:complete